MSEPFDDNIMTPDEAFRFVREALGMSSPRSKLKSSPQNFLQELIRQWMHHLPWQTITGIATPHLDRHLPTLSEMKEDMTKRLGGMCYQHNVFCYVVLKALGFDVSLIACDVAEPSDHAAIIAHHVINQDSMHYIDVGTGTPILRAVPLDFQQESPVYHDSYLRYKFSRHGDIIYCYHSIEGHALKSEIETMGSNRINDGWVRLITIPFRKNVELSYFIPSMTPIYTVADKKSFYLSSARCMAFPGGRFVCIKDTTFLIENVPGCVSKSYFRSRKEIKDAFGRFFPQFLPTMLDDALNDDFVDLDYGKGINND